MTTFRPSPHWFVGSKVAKWANINMYMGSWLRQWEPYIARQGKWSNTVKWVCMHNMCVAKYVTWESGSDIHMNKLGKKGENLVTTGKQLFKRDRSMVF